MSNVPVNCLLKLRVREEEEIASHREIRGSDTILNKLEYIQYKAHSPNHLSN